MRDFRKLEVWSKSHRFTLKVYKLTQEFPQNEKYGLISQLRRASASIPANLAEGGGRESDGDFRRFVEIAGGSACEVEYHLLLAKDLGLLDQDTYERFDLQINEIKKMLGALARRLRTNPT
ncbi:MAG: four helix bundle protein [Pirellulales bacterium]|nr:four helix bundle protein [Pirellulales bacterium]